jgi:mRNA-degrading endonuclease RelE of RelBE toxin-antitoxin system
MGTRLIKIVKSAFRQIQRLSHVHFEDVADILMNMNKGDFGDRKKLEGYKDLWRTRKGDTRVIWSEDNDNILIIRAGKRDDIYQKLAQNINISSPLPLSAILEIEEDKINELPTYEWNSYIHKSWYSFVYGDYLRSPILTSMQKSILGELRNPEKRRSLLRSSTIYDALLEGSAGTGKTVCAALIACDYYQLYEWNTFIVLPANLINEVKKFSTVENCIKNKNKKNFFIGNFREFVELLCPEGFRDKIASTEEEIKAFRKEALRVNIINKNHTFKHNSKLLFSERELFLYRAFVDRDSKGNRGTGYDPSNFSFYNENLETIRQLLQIKQDKVNNNLGDGQLTWTEALRQLQTKANMPFTENTTSLIVFDEAQDHSLSEYKTLKKILERWRQESGGKQCFVLLAVGDTNQRVQPTDFHWGRLKLSREYTLKYNYRNTRHILEFANIFWKFAQEKNAGQEALPKPSNPSNSFEIGEPIKLIECPSKENALEILSILNQKIKSSDGNKRSIFSKLSKKLAVITQCKINSEYSDLECITIQQAKGREFDACVAFCIFDGDGIPSIEEANTWYTTVTRSRYRLLVISTSSEIERLGRDKFKFCDHHTITDKEIPLDWIVEWASSEHLFKDKEAIINLILEGLRSDTPEIYWDTYSVLKNADILNETINEMEKEAINILSLHPEEILEKELLETNNIASEIDKILLKCLLLRSLNRSWEAVDEISKLANLNNQNKEYNRLLHAIVNDLNHKNLYYEAARVRRIFEPSSLDNLPFGKEIATQRGSLISLLCKAAISQINF